MNVANGSDVVLMRVLWSESCMHWRVDDFYEDGRFFSVVKIENEDIMKWYFRYTNNNFIMAPTTYTHFNWSFVQITVKTLRRWT